MRSIIQRIFKDNGFEILRLKNDFEENQSEFFANYSDNAINFYLIVYLDYIKKDFLSEQVPSYFNAVKEIESGYDERMDKNLSMLVCINSNKTNEKNLSEIIFEIEEDPYFFKKYVITYDERHLIGLKSQFDAIDKNSNILLNEIVNDTEGFLNYKRAENNNESALYEICSKLMIKIPFLKLEKRVETIEDLSKKISKKLKSKGILEFNNSLLGFSENDEKLVENILAIMDGDTIE